MRDNNRDKKAKNREDAERQKLTDAQQKAVDAQQETSNTFKKLLSEMGNTTSAMADVASSISEANTTGKYKSDAGKDIAGSIQDLSKSSAGMSAKDQRTMRLKEIKILKNKLEFVTDDEEKDSLSTAINSMDKSLKETSAMSRRASEKAGDIFMGGFAALSGVFADSPLLAMGIQLIGSKIQEKRERSKEIKAATMEAAAVALEKSTEQKSDALQSQSAEVSKSEKPEKPEKEEAFGPDNRDALVASIRQGIDEAMGAIIENQNDPSFVGPPLPAEITSKTAELLEAQNLTNELIEKQIEQVYNQGRNTAEENREATVYNKKVLAAMNKQDGAAIAGKAGSKGADGDDDLSMMDVAQGNMAAMMAGVVGNKILSLFGIGVDGKKGQNIFAGKTFKGKLKSLFIKGLKAAGVVGLAASIFNATGAAYKEYAKSGDMSKAAQTWGVKFVDTIDNLLGNWIDEDTIQKGFAKTSAWLANLFETPYEKEERRKAKRKKEAAKRNSAEYKELHADEAAKQILNDKMGMKIQDSMFFPYIKQVMDMEGQSEENRKLLRKMLPATILPKPIDKKIDNAKVSTKPIGDNNIGASKQKADQAEDDKKRDMLTINVPQAAPPVVTVQGGGGGGMTVIGNSSSKPDDPMINRLLGGSLNAF